MRVLALTVAGELIGPQREGERGQPRIVRRVGEAVDAGRQQSGQLPGAERVLDRLVRRFDAEQHRGELAVRRRYKEMSPRLRLIAGDAHEGLRTRVEALGRRSDRVGTGEQDRNGLRLAGACKNRVHGYSAASRIVGLAA